MPLKLREKHEPLLNIRWHNLFILWVYGRKNYHSPHKHITLPNIGHADVLTYKLSDDN